MEIAGIATAIGGVIDIGVAGAEGAGGGVDATQTARDAHTAHNAHPVDHMIEVFHTGQTVTANVASGTGTQGGVAEGTLPDPAVLHREVLRLAGVAHCRVAVGAIVKYIHAGDAVGVVVGCRVGTC